MAFTTCPDCGSRVYERGCVNCNEAAYIEEQADLDESYELDCRLSEGHACTNACGYCGRCCSCQPEEPR